MGFGAGPEKTAAELIVFMLRVSVGMQDVC